MAHAQACLRVRPVDGIPSAFYIVVYLIMYPTGIAFMAGLVRRGPQQPELETPVDQIESGRPHEPFESAARAAPQP